jgi:acetylornithine aminotransferase
MTATGQAKVRQGFEPLPPGFAQVPYNDSEALEAALTPQVAAIMLEPLQGEGGVRPGDPSYFQRVRQLCDERGILLIMDEVQTGMGRTGTLWGYQQLGIEPDAITSAKGLAGGIPMGAMLCKRFCDAFEPGDHASTFGGNPLACAAALAVGQTLERDGLPVNARARGEQLRSRLTALARQFPQLFEGVRGWGVISGLVLRADARLEALDIVKAALQQGLLVAAAGAGVVRLVPPLIVSADEVERGADALERAVGQLAH